VEKAAVKPTIKKRSQRCSHGWVMDTWWELRVNNRSIELGNFETAIGYLESMYRNGLVIYDPRSPE
jgi:hypothetical protein